MALLKAAELRRIEREYADGISSGAIVEMFQKRGERFSEPTLRKYVQLGLLPKSRRVGVRGRHRGSSGLYPVGIVRLINEIKRSLDAGSTLEEIRLGPVGLVGELEALRSASQKVMGRFDEAILRNQQTKSRQQMLRRRLEKHRRALNREIKRLDKLAMRLGEQRGR